MNVDELYNQVDQQLDMALQVVDELKTQLNVLVEADIIEQRKTLEYLEKQLLEMNNDYRGSDDASDSMREETYRYYLEKLESINVQLSDLQKNLADASKTEISS